MRHIPSGIFSGIFLLLLAALAGAMLAWLTFPQAPPEVRYSRVVVPESVLVHQEPDTVVRLVERIRYRTVAAEVQATARGAAELEVREFCARPAPIAVETGSPVGPPVPAKLLIRSMAFDGAELRAWGPRSDGDLWSGSYQVRAPWRAAVMGDSLLVQGDRSAGLRRWAERAVWAGVGAGLGYAASELR